MADVFSPSPSFITSALENIIQFNLININKLLHIATFYYFVPYVILTILPNNYKEKQTILW